MTRYRGIITITLSTCYDSFLHHISSSLFHPLSSIVHLGHT
ncbi:Uncharacterized protein BM_BM422 [Brugia malayi]|uniref:Bm422 n=1 Tax=Brugia malayi TaxID=6279 RepID=A0A0J9XSM9_BRUMA|nr:Uncharacterized protein BM_BM422 [Brugia malayi]CDP94881.1 Bm422 [Brugia malayi]VIO87022.1 Uncharacterized protein BM_BM422 [Brugia malayi]